jgi:hypothetical protein
MKGTIENLFRAYPRIIEWITGTSDYMRKPEPGKAWLLLSGHVSHVTGTISYFNVVEPQGALTVTRCFIKSVAAATASRNYPIFEQRTDLDTATNSRVGDQQAAWCPFFIFPGQALYFDGAATAGAICTVLEFDA